MTKTTYAERLAVIETDLKEFKTTQKAHNERQQSDIHEIKTMLQEHCKWESEKYKAFRKDFAAKRVEYIVYGMLGLIFTAFMIALIRIIMLEGGVKI